MIVLQILMTLFNLFMILLFTYATTRDNCGKLDIITGMIFSMSLLMNIFLAWR